MNSTTLEQIIDAVLYEGYILYPYRPSSKKNRRERFTFGRVYPESYSRQQKGAEPCLMQTECLVETAGHETILCAQVGFLHPTRREIGRLEVPQANWTGGEPRFDVVPELRAGKEVFQSWLEAVERRVEVIPLRFDSRAPARQSVRFHFAAARELEPIVEGQVVVGVIVRRRAAIEGTIELATQPLDSGVVKITVQTLNQTSVPEFEPNEIDPILPYTLASTHTVLRVEEGAFVSSTDPPARHKQACQLCKNIGTWPVLVGEETIDKRRTLLSSPIILYDYPQIAPESAGPLFDGTEIDEILTLRILTMTDEEKTEMRRVDEQARRLLERTEALGQDSLLQMHGAMRTTQGPEPENPPAKSLNSEPSAVPIEFDDFFGANTRLEGVSVEGTYLHAGSRVRIRPKARADLLDLAVNGQTAIIEAVEQDAEKRIHLAVVLEDDPGKDLGLLRQPGHRFFYGVDEVEPLSQGAA